MFKKSGLALMVACAVSGASARDYTIVEKDTYGTGLYYSGTVVGDRAFVASGLKKFEQFNVANPASLVKQADTSVNCIFTASKILADGNTLAVQCPFTIEFFDISDPDNISLIGTYDSTSYAVNGIVLEGNRLYMLGGNSDIVVFDATDLTNLVELGRADVGSVQTDEVKKVGDYLYAVNSIESFDIYDVSDPANPSKVGSHPAVGTVFYEAEVIGNYAYLGTGVGIQVVDISDKTSPVMVTNVNQDDDSNSISGMSILDYDGTNFIAIDEAKKVRSIDLSNPALPTISVAKLEYDFWVKDAVINGDSLVLFSGVDGIRTIDISDSTSYVQQDHFTESMKPVKISLDGDSALIAGEEQAYHVIDIDSDLNLRERGRIGEYYNFRDGLLVGDTVYVNRNNEFSTINISDIDNPMVTDTDTLGTGWGGGTDYQKSGSQLIVGTATAELGVYDYSAIGLTEVVSADLGADPVSSTYRGVVDIAQKGDYLYVTTQETDVTIVDISDPANPVIAHHEWSSYDGGDRHLEIFGNRLFIARDIGLLVIDITDPTSPQFIENNPSFGLPENIQAIDERYAVINNSSTLYLVDFMDPTNPTIIHEFATNTQFSDLAADLTKILAANLNGSEVKSFQINQAPAATDAAASVDEDIALDDRVTVTDREDDTLTFTITQDVSNGSLTLNNDGTYTYQPAANFNGSDSFTFDVADVHGGFSSGQVDITINAVNDAPVVDSDSLAVDEDMQLTATLSASDVEASPLTFALVNAPAQGVLSLQANGDVTYDPVADFNGDVQFEVTVNDGELDSAVKTITISIAAVNDAPVASATDLTVDEDGSVNGTASATDVEGDTLTYNLGQPATDGTATVNSDGSYSYAPNANFNGTDSFTLMANDGTDNSAPVTVNVTINPVNDAPTASNSSGSVVEGSTLNGSLVVNDVDGDTLTFTVETSPTNGTVSINATGGFSYTPVAEFTGNDSFSFTATDPAGESATATVTISVTAAPKGGGGGSLNWLLLLGLALLGRRASK